MNPGQTVFHRNTVFGRLCKCTDNSRAVIPVSPGVGGGGDSDKKKCPDVCVRFLKTDPF